MAKGIKFEMVKDNTKEVIAQKDAAIQTALEAIGLRCARHAAMNISGADGHPTRVHTGNLRNSISHQVAGAEEAVYVGTNVEYAVYVHDGTRKMDPNRFLRDAASDYSSEYRDIAKMILST